MSETKETVDRKSTEEFGLKPCPFCGKKQSEWSPDCACGNPALDSMTKGAWNRRPIEDALRARIAELEAEIDQLTAHDATERQDDKSPNDTQTQKFVYGKARVDEQRLPLMEMMRGEKANTIR